MAIFIVTGGTGFVGNNLVNLLISNSHQVYIYTRDKQRAGKDTDLLKYVYWNPSKNEIDVDPFKHADYIINLAGAGIAAKRWTGKYKEQLINSRLQSAKLLFNTARNTTNKIKKIISASAVGYYGADKLANNPFLEKDPAASDFLAQLCVKWESSILEFKQVNIEPIILRTGIVLGKEGGTLKELLTPLKFNVATILGNGQQIYSWIDVNDLSRIYMFACLNEQIKDNIFNAVAPNPISQKEIVILLAKKICSFYLPLKTPAFLLKLMIGEVTSEITKSTNVSASKILNEGFQFDSPDYLTYLQSNF